MRRHVSGEALQASILPEVIGAGRDLSNGGSWTKWRGYMPRAGLATGRSCAMLLGRDHVLQSDFSIGRILFYEQHEGRNFGSHVLHSDRTSLHTPASVLASQTRPDRQQRSANMSEPPSYEEAASTVNQIYRDEKLESKGMKRFSIREEVVASRSQHVAALVSRILPHVRERAQSGLSRSMLLLLPSDQGVHHSCRLSFTADHLAYKS